MKKFFKGGSSKKGIKSESAVSIKSRSLQAITQQDDSDDDGGQGILYIGIQYKEVAFSNAAFTHISNSICMN